MKILSACVATLLFCVGTGCVEDDDATRIQAITTESGACKVIYETSDWPGGFTGNVSVTNKGAAKSGWRLEWTFPGTQRVGSIWNASASQAGARVTTRNVGWNGALGRGATVSFGFNGSWSGSNPTPVELSLDGVSCGTSGGGGGGGGGGGEEPECDWDPYTCEGGGEGFAALVSSSTFDAMFPSRNPFYTHAGLVAATASFPGFAATGDLTTRKREAAAFLANAAHETGGLVYIEEIAQGQYCSPSASCPCAPGKRYFGRGPIQLSWNYNYCAAGAALGLPLQSNPDLVASNATVAWQTSLWFWNTQTGAGTMTAHDAMAQGRGFGETIRTINGALECNGGNPGQVQSRIDAYRRFCQMLGVDPGANLGC